LHAAETGKQKLLRDTNLHVIFGVTLMAVLGVSTITPVLPHIAAAFDRSPQAVALIIAVFTLPGAIFTPVMGVLGDRFGRKKVLVPSLVVFALAGTACGFAHSFEALVALRFLQGFGASALGAINVTLLGDLYSGTERATAMGYNGSVLSVGTGLYPAIGGGLALFGWYFPFFLPSIALVVALAVVFLLNNPEPKVNESLGRYAAVTVRAMLHPQVLTLFATSVVTFVLIYGSFLAYFPFVLEISYGASPVVIGLILSATSIPTAIASFYLGDLAARFGSRALVKTGFALYVLAMAGIPLTSSLWQLAIPVLIFGAANGLNVPSILTILNGYAPTEFRAAFMSMNGTVLRLGQTLGPVLVGVAVEWVGMNGSFFVSAVLALAMLLLLLPTLRLAPALK
jgi:ACDE family multidrug resistance protein